MMDGWPAGYDGWMATIHDGWTETTRKRGRLGNWNIYIQYASRNPAALKHNIKPLFQLWGANLKMFSKFGVSSVTRLHHFGVHLSIRNSLGTKMVPESIQLRKGTTPGVECYLLFLTFWTFLGRCPSKMCFCQHVSCRCCFV